jgi:hypothetical protein
MRRAAPWVILITLLPILSGCAAWSRATRPIRQAGAAAFTGASVADLSFEGNKTGACVPIQAIPAGNVSDDTSRALMEALGAKPVGCLLPLTRVGETKPWWIFCAAGEMEQNCSSIQLNSRVSFAGQPLGVGGVWIPSRLRASE